MPAFTIETATEKDIFIVRAIGYLDEKGGHLIRKAIEEAFGKGFQKYILNFCQAPVINSPGVAQLLELSEIIVDERKGQVAYVGLNELTLGVFKMVGLMNAGEAFNSEPDAISSF